jgi:predicted transcriptional regulator
MSPKKTKSVGRQFGALEKGSQSSKILAYVLKHPGLTAREVCTKLKLPQVIVSTALIVHVKAGRLTRTGEKYRFQYFGPTS